MAITLKQIPGFADVADSNFAAEHFAIGLNFQRTIDNAKFGMVRPEAFVGRYINGDVVPLPVSPVDGYTYQRSELVYLWHFGLTGGTGGTSTSSNGNPSQPGAIRYLAASVDQLTGTVATNVEYLVGDGSGPNITTDGTLEVFTLATRRKVSLSVLTPPTYTEVLDSELATDDAVTESLMQRINENAKFAALRSEVIYMGEFTDGLTVPQPVSPVDGYVYSYAETKFLASWRWTTQGDSLTDPSNPNFKQIEDFSYSIAPTTGVVGIQVQYYHSGVYNSTNGRLAVMAFCERAVTLGAGVVDFVDLSVDFLASGRPSRADVLARQVRNTRFAICRREFFMAEYTNGATVALPTSPVDGYTYSRDELTYVYDYVDTFLTGASIRMSNWHSTIDQASGAVSSSIMRVQEGGGFVPTVDGTLRVITVARRGHFSSSPGGYLYSGNGTGGSDLSALLNGGFDNWYKSTSLTADNWAIETIVGTGYGAQAAGLVSGFSQRLGAAAGGDGFTVLSSRVSIASTDLRFFSWVTKASGAGTLSVVMRFYNVVGDSCSLDITSYVPDTTLIQTNCWVQIPSKDDTTVATNFGDIAITGLLDFVPTSVRIEFSYTDPSAVSYVDLDEVTFISQYNPSIGQVAQRGSSSLAFSPSIPFVVTDTDFTPDLDFNVQRVDGTTTVVADGSGTTVTGLTASTAYKWYPYLNEITKHVGHVMTGGVGTPPWLQTVATRALFVEWYAQGHLPFSASPIDVVTVATAAPPGGGFGGGDDGCLQSKMYVLEFTRGAILCEDLKVGDVIKGQHGSWLDVLAVETAPHRDWCELTFSHGGSLRVTSGHPFLNAETGELVRADSLTLATVLDWESGITSPIGIQYIREDGIKVKISVAAPHLFYAGRTPAFMTLTHNRPIDGISTL